MARRTQTELFEDYEGFVEKFKPKKTTDDCYTPPEIYDVVLQYVVDRYGIDPTKVLRPFVPGGDYQREEYPEGWCVVDNPPFSILSEIIGWYYEMGVPFFLFAPSLTCLSSRRYVMKVNHIICDANITYENGAVVRTAFVTNMGDDDTVIESAPDLGDIINAKNEELQRAKKRTVGNYAYPDHVLTAAKVGWFAAHHTPFKLKAADCCPISKLDKMGDKGIFGGGLLLSNRAAAERAAAERAAAERAAAERAAATKWELSERELMMVEMLDRQAS